MEDDVRVLVINSWSSSIKYQVVDVFEGATSLDLKLGAILLREAVKDLLAG